MSSSKAIKANETFISEVRRALNHLYDPAYLRESPLMVWLHVQATEPVPLARILTEAITTCRPAVSERNDRAWRAYRALYHRYVDCFPPSEVAANLSLSVRQLRREERRALITLCDYLWFKYELSPERISATDKTPQHRSRNEERLDMARREAELAWRSDPKPNQAILLADLLHSTVETVRPLAREFGVSLNIVDSIVSSQAQVHQASLRQALIHLWSSAIRAAPNGSVVIDAGENDRQVWIRMMVSGSHCYSEEDLRIASHLVTLAGGALEEIPNSPATGDYVINLRMAENHKTILVIDDNKDTLRLYGHYLRGTGYRYVGQNDPMTALEVAQTDAPAVIFLDVMLPGIDGWELLGRLKEHPKTRGIPIIVCTVLPEQHLSLALGAAAFLRKPIKRSVFLQTIRSQLDAPTHIV